MNAGNLQKYFIEKLSVNYNEREIRIIFFQVLEEIFGIDRIHFFLDKDRVFTPAEMRKIQAIIRQLLTYKPLQYILGTAVFRRLHLKVGPEVLIPRPETEELADLILQRTGFPGDGPVNILDIGTGSGCLAISLALTIAGSKAWACDLMDKALKIASKNAKMNQAEVQFFQLDILNQELPVSLPPMDLIVSNPPYVTESEKNQMKPNVLLFEPPEALFVPDDDPLMFYRFIAMKSYKQLKENGKLFLEINEAYGQEVVKLLEENLFRDVMLWNDIHGKDRFVEGKRQ